MVDALWPNPPTTPVWTPTAPGSARDWRRAASGHRPAAPGVRAARAWGRAARPGEPGPLPDFLVIGGQRCGTTSLYHHLAAHPQVRAASGKELQYFSVHHGRGVRWYRGTSAPRSR
ncbi:hypothetical protein NKG94_14940 [Micromonospora sp. M12]